MDLAQLNRFDRFFGELPDRPGRRAQRHPLGNLLAMALCGSICGADDCESLEVFAALRASFFAALLNGQPARLRFAGGAAARGKHLADSLADETPSANAFRRVLALFEPRAFAAAFAEWTRAFTRDLAGVTLASDGTPMRVGQPRRVYEGPFVGVEANVGPNAIVFTRPGNDVAAMT
jgi:hypothetical protein